ncbi:MAG: EAL domain-containing protein [Burkholderiales bacterium]
MASDRISQYIAQLPDASAAGSSLRRVGASRVAGRFLDCELASVFQPVFHPTGEVFGDTALVRCHGKQAEGSAALQIFALARSDGDLVRLDRLCRTVHAINYFISAPVGRSLFLKVDPRLLVSVPDQHGRAFERVLTSLGVAPSQVVIEIPASTNGNPALVAHVVANYRFRGYRVAVHYAGDAGWLATLVHLRAEFVIVRFPEGFTLEVLRSIVASVHEVGARVLATHLETAAAVATLRSAGVDLLQGFELGGPRSELVNTLHLAQGPEFSQPATQ